MRLVAFWSVRTDWLGTCQRWGPQVWLPLGKSWAWEAYPRIFKAKKKGAFTSKFRGDSHLILEYQLGKILPCFPTTLCDPTRVFPVLLTSKNLPMRDPLGNVAQWLHGLWRCLCEFEKNSGLIWAGCSCLASVVYASQSLCAFLNKLSWRFRTALLDVATLTAEPVNGSLHQPYLSSCCLLFLEINVSLYFLPYKALTEKPGFSFLFFFWIVHL